MIDDRLIDLAGQCYALADPIYREDKERGHALDDAIIDAVLDGDAGALRTMLRELRSADVSAQPELFSFAVPAEAKDRTYSEELT